MDNNLVVILEAMVNSFTDVNELMNFAATWGIQDSLVVRFRLFQLQNPEFDQSFVNEQLDNFIQTTDPSDDFELALEYVKTQEEIEGSLRALLFDIEMDDLAQACIQDGEWCPEEDTMDQSQQDLSHEHPSEPASPMIQEGRGAEPQMGPSHRPDTPPRQGLQYNMRKKSERTYAKNAAMDHTYQIKVDERHHREKLDDIRNSLHQMFDDVLNEARGDLVGNDLGRVVIQHEALHDPIVIPLQPWDQLNADMVMGTIKKVLNSNLDLAIDESMDITIGAIDLSKGSGGPRRRITKIKGKNNSLQLKTSIVTIENEDQLCMARAIGVSWAKLKRCTPEEWKEITKNRNKKWNLQLILENQKVPETYYKDLTKKKRDKQRQIAVAISQLAGVPMDRRANLNDLEAFEEVLGVRMMVVSARLGNKK